MGVFPLADTMIRCSDAPWSRGSQAATAEGWTNEGWWYAHPTTPRRDAAAAHSPTFALTPSALITRCSDRWTDRSAVAVTEFAAGNDLQ
jgi:hypothetical protein